MSSPQFFKCARCGYQWRRRVLGKPSRCAYMPCRTTQWETNQGRKPESHGHATKGNRRTYSSWAKMLGRCFNPKDHRFADYGGRGITVCDRWRDSFANFLEDMGERPKETTLDRYPNNDGNYEPGNCRWATAIEQQNNIRRNVLIEFQGASKTIPEWSRQCGVKPSTIRRRIASNWPLEQVFSLPLMQGVRPKERLKRIQT